MNKSYNRPSGAQNSSRLLNKDASRENVRASSTMRDSSPKKAKLHTMQGHEIARIGDTVIFEEPRWECPISGARFKLQISLTKN